MPGVGARGSESRAARDLTARFAAGPSGAARARAHDATPRSPAPSSDPRARKAAPARTGSEPRDRQTTRPSTDLRLDDGAEASHRKRSNRPARGENRLAPLFDL